MWSETNGQLVSQGAESRVWRLTHAGVSAIKKERFAKRYRIAELDDRLARERTRAELRAIKKIKTKCPELGRTMPDILDSSDRNIIMTELTDAITVCHHFRQTTAESRDDVLKLIGEVVARIHGVGVIHGDLTTSNFMLVKDGDGRPGVVPIDFGLASFSTKAEDRAVDLYVLERALISAHPNANFEALLESYAKIMPNSDQIVKKLDAVRLRGRKRLMIG